MPDYMYDHIHLYSPDPLKTAQFYEDMFNAERVNARELPNGQVSVELSLSGSRILIMQQSADAKPVSTARGAVSGLEHFGIRTDDIETAVTDLKAKGVEFRDDIWEIRPGIKISFLWAPEDVLIELLEVMPRNE